ncbi:MFS transporter [Plantactinospora sp. GCM10030261]|uniref:MFS transporter n=1 Tax=Plantactinospora sp. GCM10030261 TaxID=3273420 RepID=UPI00361738F9
MTAETATKAGRAAWIGLAVLALPTFVIAVDLFVLLLALPALAADLGANSVEQLWASDIYGFLLAGFLVSMGTLGDRVGRRKLLMVGGALFTIGSVLTAFAPTIELLLLARAALGVAGATLMPSTIGLIGGLFQDPKQRATAFGIWGGVYTLGASCGPVVGGMLLEYFWWGSVFLVAVPFLLVMLALGPKYLPEFSNPNAGRIDFASIALSLLALLPIIYGLKEMVRSGSGVVPLLSLIIGLVFGVLFVRRQNRLAEPLLDLKLLKNGVITATLTNALLFSGVGGGLMLLMLLFFQLVDGFGPLQAALLMIPGMVAGAVGMQVAPKLAARFRPGRVIGVGVLLAGLTYLILTQVTVENGTWLLVTVFVLASLFGTASVGLGTGLVVGNAPPEKMGSAGSLAQLCLEFGGTLGLALLGTVATAVYRGSVDVPAGVSGNHAAVAGDSLAGAAATASQLPAGLADELLASAHAAFVDGIRVLAFIGLALYVLGGLLVIARLRSVPAFGQPAPPPEADSAAPVRAETPA